MCQQCEGRDPNGPVLKGQIHGGELDGAEVSLIDTGKVALTLFVDTDGILHLQSVLTPNLIADILDRVAAIARERANEWQASLS